MVTSSSAPGSRRRARRAAAPFGLIVLLGVPAIVAAGGSGGPRPGHHALTGFGSSGLRSHPGGEGASAAPRTPATGAFTIAGTVGGLYPGFTGPLVLTVANPQAFTIVVSSITTSVTDATATCLASNLSVGAFSGQLSVPAFGSAQTSVPAGLAPSAPDACIGATFPLSYSGLASRAKK